MDGDGATAVLESPASTTVAPQTPVTPSQPAKVQPESTQSTDKTPVDKNDRRMNPDALWKYLAAQRAVPENAEHVQAIERSLGENKSYKSVYPTVREAREAKASLDAVGGREKLAELQTYSTSMREVDEMLEAGDPRVVDKIMETGPKGLVKILPALIEQLSKADPQGISAAIQPHVASYLDSQGLPDALDAMAAAFNGGKPDEAKAILAKIIGWGKKVFGAQSESVKPPEQAEWEKERDGFQQKAFAGDVEKAFNESMTYADSAIAKEMAPYLKKYGIPEDRASVIAGDIWKRIEKERNADGLFKSTIATKVNERSRKVDPSTAGFLNSQLDQRLKDATRKEMELRYGFIGKKADPDPNKKVDVTAAPSGATISIDYGKTTAKYGSTKAAQDAIMSGRAVNSSGKPIIKIGKVWKIA